MRKREEDSLKKDTATPISLLVLLWPHGLFQIPGDSVLYRSPHSHKSCLVPPLWQQYLPIPQYLGLVPLTPPHGQAPLSALYCQHCGVSHLRPLTLPLVWTCRCQLGLPLLVWSWGSFPSMSPPPGGTALFQPPQHVLLSLTRPQGAVSPEMVPTSPSVFPTALQSDLPDLKQPDHIYISHSCLYHLPCQDFLPPTLPERMYIYCPKPFLVRSAHTSLSHLSHFLHSMSVPQN